MVSPHQGCRQLPSVLPVASGCPESSASRLKARAGQSQAAALAVLAALLGACPPDSAARDTSQRHGMQRMTENDLSRVHARGFHDRYFDRISRYLMGGMAVEVLGDMGVLLNPLSMMLDAETTYRDVVFNPNSPWMVSDGLGSAYLRLPQSIGEISIRNIRIPGTRGASFGSVTIRDIDLNGTTIKITKR